MLPSRPDGDGENDTVMVMMMMVTVALVVQVGVAPGVVVGHRWCSWGAGGVSGSQVVLEGCRWWW